MRRKRFIVLFGARFAIRFVTLHPTTERRIFEIVAVERATRFAERSDAVIAATMHRISLDSFKVEELK